MVSCYYVNLDCHKFETYIIYRCILLKNKPAVLYRKVSYSEHYNNLKIFVTADSPKHRKVSTRRYGTTNVVVRRDDTPNVPTTTTQEKETDMEQSEGIFNIQDMLNVTLKMFILIFHVIYIIRNIPIGPYL